MNSEHHLLLVDTPANGDTSAKKKLTLSFDEYKMLTDMLVVFMRKEEVEAETRGEYTITSLIHQINGYSIQFSEFLSQK